ncbi:dentin sialophosphoprotein-like isoform X2 [Juglans microcarpa x Juglans regia]|uniref:dentin sialophosphoprotein-like isoform X2 n=1 Tax=Juglans microcarpa x Juglans regia TaxID=2249226 RepID=UPI001B7F1441|nr:dentin sialophosphoprotein-like isoform X2 [Juglans microcarpa x Juglans regia]
MFKQSPSRNHRSKGIRLKHVLQICLLLGICFWLIYQVKHSHDKKKAFDENDANLSAKTRSGGELLNFGRKDLHPYVKEVTKKDKHGGEEEEESKHGEDEQEEENKHEVDEQEDEENKSEETEDEERGVGDDEIDENDQEKLDGEADRDEEFIDDEKEGKEDDRKSEDKDSQVETSLEDQDHDDGTENIHEAREEHYKGDDASSAVAHDTQTIISETENLSSENSIKKSEMNIVEQENKSNGTQEIDRDQKNPEIKLVEGGMHENGTSLNVITVEQEGNDSFSNSVDSSDPNSTVTSHSNDQFEATNNTKLVSNIASNTFAEVSIGGNNSTDTDIDTSGSSQKNGTASISDSALAQNITVDLSNTISESNQSDGNSTVSIKNEEAGAGSGESTSANNSESALSEKITTEAEDGSVSSISKENTDAGENKLDGRDEPGGNKKSSDNYSRDEIDVIEHDPIDASDSHIALDEKGVRIDLDTLPDIRTEWENSKDVAAE